MRYSRSIIAFAFVILLPALAGAFYQSWENGPWERHDTDEGFTIYLNEKAHDDVVAVRVDGTIDAPANELFDLVKSHKRAKNQPDVVAYKVLEDRPDGFLTYQRVDPTGISPRDFVLEGTLIEPKGGSGSYALRWKASTRGPKPNDDWVRVKTAEGVLSLEPVDDDTTRVSYRSLFDPDVSAPGFIIERALISDAVARLVRLRKAAR